jgi:uncharacterized protein with HEPN domain
MRREDLYLCDILEAADAIEKFISGISEKIFRENDLIRSAVLQKLLIIGESAARLSDDFKAKRPELPWRDIVGFRNIAIHAYFAVDWEIVWGAAKINAPQLRNQIAEILSKDYPNTYKRFQDGTLNTP